METSRRKEGEETGGQTDRQGDKKRSGGRGKGGWRWEERQPMESRGREVIGMRRQWVRQMERHGDRQVGERGKEKCGARKTDGWGDRQAEKVGDRKTDR